MRDRLRVLILEDQASDAELVADALRQFGFEVDWTRVDRKADYLAALEGKPDVVLADFKVPGFGALDALEAAREQGSNVPVIIISGSLGDELAAECIKCGASDYLLKDRLSRLGAAVTQALERRRLRGEAMQAEQALRASEIKFRELIEQASDGIFVTDQQGKLKLVNPRFCEMLGYGEEELLRLNIEDTHADADRALLAQRLASLGEVKRRTFERMMRRKDGTLFPVEISIRRLSTGLNQGIVRDITERKKAEIRILGLNRVYAVLSGINATIVRAKDREELFREACRIAVEAGQFVMAWIGLVDKEAKLIRPAASAGAVGGFFEQAPLAMGQGVDDEGLAPRAIRQREPVVSGDIQNDPRSIMREACRERGIHSVAFLPLLIGGEAVGVLGLYAGEPGFFDEEEMKLLLELAGDISFALDHIEKSNRLDYLAYYDATTGVANRKLLLERLDQRIRIAAEKKGGLALTILDLERFKNINDTLGRHAGDQLLKVLAERFVKFVGDADRVGRVLGDQFGIIIPGARSADEVARRVDRKLKECVGVPVRVGDNELRISAKVGIALYPEDGADADTLFRNAEAALNRAKAAGERYLFYTEQMTERVGEKLALENKLRQALEKEEFVLHYQPKVDTVTRRIESVEALIRWQSPELGLVPPMQFIPLLEETGLILEVGAWALRRAARDYRRWSEQGLNAPRIAVNVSAIQLRQRDFVESVRNALGGRASGIDLEVTESLIMEDIQACTQKLKAVRLLGANIAIDDFGTGYSSLAYLAKLPVQELKIDRSFIITMLGDPAAMTLVSTIISMAHSLRLNVVAEGVDEEGQAKELKRLGCDQMQGYLFSKPVEFDKITVLLGKREGIKRITAGTPSGNRLAPHPTRANTRRSK
jgi:diguanylate cyclase (GGDEF)-like protein/PAS domain S-box-containing protein